jgi:hypothetical protein
MSRDEVLNDIEGIIEKVAKLLFVIDYIHTDTHDKGDMYDNIETSTQHGQRCWEGILKEFVTPNSNWYNKKHVGDCVKLPMTCSTCLYEEYIENAINYLNTGKIEK